MYGTHVCEQVYIPHMHMHAVVDGGQKLELNNLLFQANWLLSKALFPVPSMWGLLMYVISSGLYQSSAEDLNLASRAYAAQHLLNYLLSPRKLYLLHIIVI